MPGTMMQNLNIFRSLVGREHMDHCVLLTTKWGSVKNEQYDAREGELIHKTEFWRNNIKDGAITMRFGGSRQSALEVLTCATQQASFLPRISQEYIVNGSALIDTAAGRAINTDLEEIRATHVDSLASIRSEYSEVLEANYIDTTASMKGLYATTEKKIQEVAEELRSLSYSREAEQRRLDHIEMVDFSLSTHETPGDRESDRESELLARRKKRALRWFVRFAGLGVVVVTTALTHGAMAPVGVGLMVSIESVLQAAKANERDDWRLKKY